VKSDRVFFMKIDPDFETAIAIMIAINIFSGLIAIRF